MMADQLSNLGYCAETTNCECEVALAKKAQSEVKEICQDAKQRVKEVESRVATVEDFTSKVKKNLAAYRKFVDDEFSQLKGLLVEVEGHISNVEKKFLSLKNIIPNFSRM